MKKKWKLSPKVKEQIESAILTFFTSFLLIFCGSIVDAENIDLDFLQTALVAALIMGVRAVAKEIIFLIKK